MKAGILTLLLVLLLVAGAQGQGIGQVELMRFNHWLDKDQTKDRVYNDSGYKCLDFALDLCKNASDAGYDLKIISIDKCSRWPNGHFLTTLMVENSTWILIEPQDGKDVTVSYRADGIQEQYIIFSTKDMVRTAIDRIKVKNTAVIGSGEI